MRSRVWFGFAVVAFALIFVADNMRAEETLSDDVVQALIKTDPEMHFKLKDSAGQALTMHKWTKGKAAVFVIFDLGHAIKTLVAGESKVVPAKFKDEEYKVDVLPHTGPKLDNEPTKIETRLRKVLISPEYTEYALQDKTVMRYQPTAIGQAAKPEDIKAKLTIGKDEYDVVEAYTVLLKTN